MAEFNYTPELADRLWNFIENNPDETFIRIGKEFGITTEQVRKLSMLQAEGMRQEFTRNYKLALEKNDVMN